VGEVTLGALLTAPARVRAGELDGYRFCRTPSCDVVYFSVGTGERFGTGELRVPVFQKSADSQRPVCYCFEHSVADVQEEVARTGGSLVPDSIAEKCRQGLDRCEETNPQGACCLGNVREVVASAGAAAPATSSLAAAPAAQEAHDCCAVEPATGAPPAPAPRTPGARAPLWSAGGALLASALSSACCWLPLILIGFGVSAAGVAGFFEAYRAWFLGGTVLLLGAGFYFAYRRPACAPGDACAVPDPRLQRLTRGSLWVATAAVVALAAFPSYVGVLLAAPGSAPALAAAAAPGSERAYAIEGMTCEGCAAGVRAALEALPGVASAEVSYANGRARVRLRPGAIPDDGAVSSAVAALGYQASPVRRAAPAGQDDAL